MVRVLGKYDRLASWNFNEEKIENKQDKISTEDYFCEKNGRFTHRHGREKKKNCHLSGAAFLARKTYDSMMTLQIFFGVIMALVM